MQQLNNHFQQFQYEAIERQRQAAKQALIEEARKQGKRR
jgi:hypothetical protein